MSHRPSSVGVIEGGVPGDERTRGRVVGVSWTCREVASQASRGWGRAWVARRARGAEVRALERDRRREKLVDKVGRAT